MPHYIYGIATLIISSAFVFLSLGQFKSKRFDTAALLLVFAGLALRIFAASDLFLHEWDERYHALVAKNMLGNFFVPVLYRTPLLPYPTEDWSSNFIWLHKQPLPLWLMAISMKIFGASEFALRLPSVMLSGAGIYLTYLTGSKLFNVRVGLMAAFFHAVNGLIVELTGGRAATDHIDVLFLFFVQAALAFSVYYSHAKKTYLNVLTGICIGLAVLCKWLPAFIVLPVWVILNFKNSGKLKIISNLLLILLAAVAVFAPWQIYCAIAFPEEFATEMHRNARHITETLDHQSGGIFYFVNKLFITASEMIWVALAWFGFMLYKGNKVIPRIALLVFIFVPFIFFSSINTKMQAYLVFIYPALFIVLGEFCIFLLIETANVRLFRFQKLLFAVIIFLSVRYTIERLKPLQDQSKQLAWATEFKKLTKENADKKVYVNVKHNIEGMFYTNSIMYQWIPTSEEMEGMKAKGYEVIVNKNPDL